MLLMYIVDAKLSSNGDYDIAFIAPQTDLLIVLELKTSLCVHFSCNVGITDFLKEKWKDELNPIRWGTRSYIDNICMEQCCVYSNLETYMSALNRSCVLWMEGPRLIAANSLLGFRTQEIVPMFLLKPHSSNWYSTFKYLSINAKECENSQLVWRSKRIRVISLLSIKREEMYCRWQP